MAYIQPTGIIKIIRDSQLGKDYNHTILFSSQSQQIDYFDERTVFKIDGSNYQNYTKNSVRVDIGNYGNPETILTCDYLAFRNPQFNAGTNLWFYAFIDRVTRLNNRVFEIEYTIDPLQTWFFYMKVEPCFVEREHTLTDYLWEHIETENLDTGGLVVQNKKEFKFPLVPTGESTETEYSAEYAMMIFYVANEKTITARWTGGGTPLLFFTDGGSEKYSEVNNLIFGSRYIVVPVFNETSFFTSPTKVIQDCIDEITSISGTVVKMVELPMCFFDVEKSTTAITNRTVFSLKPKSMYYSDVFYMAQIQGFLNAKDRDEPRYSPRNKKLFSYPYRQIVIDNHMGQTGTMHWEWFSTANRRAEFTVQGVCVPQPEFSVIPYAYRGSGFDYQSAVPLTDFPEPPWNVDSFSRWWATNKDAYNLSLISSGVKGAMNVGLGVLATGVTGGVVGVVNSMLSISEKLAEKQTYRNTPDQISGQVSVSTLRFAQGRTGFTVLDMGVNKEKARIIDDYFSMYGYAVNKLKVPNVFIENATVLIRPWWNYVKTQGAIIHPVANGVYGIPSDHSSQISKILDNGITFWSAKYAGNANFSIFCEVGRYYNDAGILLDNSPQNVNAVEVIFEEETEV